MLPSSFSSLSFVCNFFFLQPSGRSSSESSDENDKWQPIFVAVTERELRYVPILHSHYSSYFQLRLRFSFVIHFSFIKSDYFCCCPLKDYKFKQENET